MNALKIVPFEELYNTEFRMSDTLAQKFKNQINSFSNAQSIMLIELDTNMAFAYSKDTKIATASSIKGPVGLYVNKCCNDFIIRIADRLDFFKN